MWLPMGMYALECSVLRDQKRSSEPLVLERQVGNQLRTGNQIWGLCKSSMYSKPLSHFTRLDIQSL